LDQRLELSIVMPCLNEAATVAGCVKQARDALAKYGITGEVVVADNGSTDGSRELAAGAGARVVAVPQRGYGRALLTGIASARGEYVVMGDADGSYDFFAIDRFLAKLREGYDLVMGNRFEGGVARGAMPFLHRWLGNPVLSFVGRLFFSSEVGDFHSGLRGFRRSPILALDLRTPVALLHEQLELSVRTEGRDERVRKCALARRLDEGRCSRGQGGEAAHRCRNHRGPRRPRFAEDGRRNLEARRDRNGGCRGHGVGRLLRRQPAVQVDGVLDRHRDGVAGAAERVQTSSRKPREDELPGGGDHIPALDPPGSTAVEHSESPRTSEGAEEPVIDDVRDVREARGL